jgi:hypothetical protein
MSAGGSFTIDEWCRHRRIGRWKLYSLWKTDRGPRFHFNGPRRLISAEADADWVREQETLAAAPEAQATIKQASARALARVYTGVARRARR